MTIVELIETQAARLGEPEAVFFGYYQAVDDRRVDDPAEMDGWRIVDEKRRLGCR